MARNFQRLNNQEITTTLPALSSEITISCLFKNTTTPSDNYPNRYALVSREKGDQINYFLDNRATSIVLEWTSATNVFHGISVPHTADTNWHGLAVSHAWGSTASSRACIDGVAKTVSGAVTNAVNTSGMTQEKLGSRGIYLERFNGDLAQVAIYDAALSENELKALSNGFSPRTIRPQSLRFFAPLVRELIDYKGATLTNTGTTVSVHPKAYL